MRAGDKLKYRSMAGEIWPAVVRSPHAEKGFVNIAILCSDKPGDVIELNRVTLRDRSTPTSGCVWPVKG